MLGISRNVLRAHLARLTLIKGRQRQLLARRES
jgi:hypothetical protein